MFTYETAEETAKRWGVTSRYVQLLCKNGKIEGAEKKAGSWFIPQGALNPEEKKKTAGIFESPTKNAIFDKAIELFAQYRFDTVSIKDIAHEIGRNQASIYNHFTSKQDILDHIYDYYCKYFLLDRPTLEELEPILQNGSLYDIINTVFYVFRSEHVDRLILVSKIIQQRQFTDERAKQIAYDIMLLSGVEFAKAVFDRAVEIGRFQQVDTYMFSLYCNYFRQGTYNSLTLNPSKEHHAQLLEEDERFKEHVAFLLKDLNLGE